ncbi:MAG TPA: hypothetical protein VLA95_05065 [Gemmatimonadales bacterium]|nr:hypothetical protein [Gemmatimonadales bacterium]
MPTLPPTALLIPLAIAAALLPAATARRMAVAGTLGFLLALAALRLDGWIAGPGLAAPLHASPTPWLVATSGLVITAVLSWIAALASGVAHRGDGAAPRVTRPLAIAGVLAAAGLASAWPALVAAGPGRSLVAGLALAAALAIVAWLGGVLRLRALLSRLVGDAVPDALARRRSGLLPWGAGFALVAFAPHLHLVLAGTALLLALGGRASARARAWAALGADVVALLALLGGWWLLWTIAGPAGGWMSRVGEIPLSPAAEYLLAPLLGLVAFRLAGVVPLAGPTGALLAPAAALLAWRLLVPALPVALPAWTAGTLALGTLGALAAGAARRVDLVLAAAGISALLAGGDAGRTGGVLLLVLAPLASPALAGRWCSVPSPARAALAAFAAWAAGEALTGTLAVEVVYSIGLVAGAAACAWPTRG